VRLLQLWARLFIAAICAQAVVLIAVAAGASPWLRSTGTYVLVSLGVAGMVILAGTVLRVRTLRRRLSRAVAGRRGAALVTARDVVEQAFAPLVDSRAVRDLAVALILPERGVLFFPETVTERETKLYEIGSLTKPMTAEVLATMVMDGTASGALSIGSVLSDLSLPAPIAQITLEELVTHQSGLPRIPRTARLTLAALFSADPYRWLDDAALLRSLARARRSAPRGTYSNFGFAVLGHVLGELHGNDYRHALESRLLHPLGLAKTYLDLEGDAASRHGRGHDLVGVPTPRWHTGAMAGAGGINMTIADAATWLAAHVDPPGPFREVVSLVTRPLASLGADLIGMGWVMREIDGTAVCWHNGGTGGFSSFAAFDRERGVGVIALAASAHVSALDRAGFQALAECAARWGHRDGAVAPAG
jgi:D-alanyl-D-alanine-carboxypeptidase/D-alanyl-D-alanine-endopeptidase